MTPSIQPIELAATHSEEELDISTVPTENGAEDEVLRVRLLPSAVEQQQSTTSSLLLNFPWKRSNQKQRHQQRRQTHVNSSQHGDDAGNRRINYQSDDDRDDDDASKRPRSCFHFVWKNVVMSVLQIGNILCWYYTNGMNGIAMESFAKEHKQSLFENTNSSNSPFFTILMTTCCITMQQLMIGAAIGRLLLFLLNSNITWRQIASTHWTPLSFLHACGSLATNLGFMYGKASVIQVLKLLEPFETLLLSQILFRQEGKCSLNVVASMTMVIAGAVFLLLSMKKNSNASTPVQAIVAALASGLLLSTRNVLQRKHQSVRLEEQSTMSGLDVLPSNTDTTSPTTSSLSKLEKSILQFTQLSFYSMLFVGVFYMLLWMGMPTQMSAEEWLFGDGHATANPNFQVFLWHPLYNVFSMITLGFCSALTHSLLNAGKRVFAICMAMIWFHEGLDDPSTLLGLSTVALGGCWYSAARKAKQK